MFGKLVFTSFQCTVVGQRFVWFQGKVRPQVALARRYHLMLEGGSTRLRWFCRFQVETQACSRMLPATSSTATSFATGFEVLASLR